MFGHLNKLLQFALPEHCHSCNKPSGVYKFSIKHYSNITIYTLKHFIDYVLTLINAFSRISHENIKMDSVQSSSNSCKNLFTKNLLTAR